MKKFIPCIKPKYLLFIAGFVWMIAGGNILRIGAPEFVQYWQSNALYLFGAIAVFLIFMSLVFYRLVQKHNARIMDMEDRKVPFYQFFDRKSYLMMIFMMTGGLLLRSAHLLPAIVIGVLYCGIGASLIGAGILFMKKFAVAVLEM
ncbi:hypothetical protein LI291_09745 [Intestinibacillus massiliensis]|uniref:hypothetical protein n=1 Tax=Intestinibacillus massiliensis TaxID=1871029 RepID=UPI000B363740|nr:hypothetical protein [Intestinibacillus massiliensis]MCB6366453.1 hypothetical protein [Intestinibacillus massiliensis]